MYFIKDRIEYSEGIREEIGSIQQDTEMEKNENI